MDTFFASDDELRQFVEESSIATPIFTSMALLVDPHLLDSFARKRILREEDDGEILSSGLVVLDNGENLSELKGHFLVYRTKQGRFSIMGICNYGEPYDQDHLIDSFIFMGDRFAPRFGRLDRIMIFNLAKKDIFGRGKDLYLVAFNVFPAYGVLINCCLESMKKESPALRDFRDLFEVDPSKIHDQELASRFAELKKAMKEKVPLQKVMANLAEEIDRHMSEYRDARPRSKA